MGQNALIRLLKRNKWAAAAACLIAFGVGAILPSLITINPSQSLGYTIFWVNKKPAAEEIRKGTYVMFNYSSDDRFFAGKTAIKLIICDEGSSIVKNGRHFWCGQSYLGFAKEKSKKGQDLYPTEFSGKIPAGFAFVSGTHPDSYDSRYIGLVDKKYIFAIGKPII